MPARDLRTSDLHAETAPPPVELAPLGERQLPLDGPHQRLAVQLVLDDYRAAKEARDTREFGHTSKGEKLTFDTWLRDLTDLYFGRREPKTEPWQYCSNRSMMIGMTILEVLIARLLPAVWNEELLHWRPGERNDIPKTERISALMAWWIRVRSRATAGREAFERWVRYALGYGTVVARSGWEVEERDTGQTGPETPVTDEAGQPLINQDGTPAVQPGERVITTVERTRLEVIPLEKVFFAKGSTNIQRDPLILELDYLYRDLEDMERHGDAANVSATTADGAQPLKDVLPVSTTASGATTPEEEAELKNVKLRNVSVVCLEWYGAVDFDGDGFPEAVRLLIDRDHQTYLGGFLQRDLSKRGLRHVNVTQFLPRLDEPNGLWGLGVLEQVKELALEIDAIFNQMTDANTLSILKPIFYDDTTNLDMGALKIAPMKPIPVQNPQASVFIPPFDLPTERLQNAIRLVVEFIERLTAASDYVLGRESATVGGSGTATRTQAILGSANQRHSLPVQRLKDGAARILSQHLDLLQTYLPPDLEQRVLGPSNEPIFQDGELSEEGLAGEYDAYLLPDEAFGSKETERELAQLLYTTLMQNVLVATDPTKIYKVTADVLKAFGKDPVVYLGPEPDYRAADTPDDEHTLLLQGDLGGVRASATDNPIEHLLRHQQFLQDPGFQALEPHLKAEVEQALMAHMQEHMQILQTVLAAAGKGQKGQPGGGNAGGNGKPDQNGGRAGGASPAPPVGPEPGVGSVQEPRAQVGLIQRRGESHRLS